jgi:uncharacterized protein
MGHRNSSAHFHDASCFRVNRSGAAGTAAGSAALKSAEPMPAAANRAAAWILLVCIRFYQAIFAPVMPLGCKFYPSCSRYAAEAIARHGAMSGSRLALARLWRCRPFTQGGFDPVPDELSRNEVQL